LGLTSEAGPAMKWARDFDKEAIRKQYLGDNFAGRGVTRDDLPQDAQSIAEPAAQQPTGFAPRPTERELPPPPPEEFQRLPIEQPEPPQPAETVPSAPLPEEPRGFDYSLDNTATAVDVPLPQTTPYEERTMPGMQPSASEVPLPVSTPTEERDNTTVQEPATQHSLSEILAQLPPTVQANEQYPAEVPLPQATPGERTYESHEQSMPSEDIQPYQPQQTSPAISDPPTSPMDSPQMPLSQIAPNARRPVAVSPKGTPAKAANVGRKPLPQSGSNQVHPAFRNQAPETASPMRSPAAGTNAAAAARAAWQAQQAQRPRQQQISPVPARKQPTKLESKRNQKSSGQSGLNKIFGRNKPSPKSRPEPVQEAPSGSQSPSDSKLGRRISMIRRKTPQQAESPTQPNAAIPEQQSMAMPEREDGPRPSFVADDHEASQAEELSRVGTAEQTEADHEFSRFDQGPLSDAPAFVPRDSIDSWEGEGAAATPSHPPAHAQGEEEDYVNSPTRQTQEPSASAYATPMELGKSHEPSRATASIDEDDNEEALESPDSPVAGEPTGMQSDRWAQIRKNAADRAHRGSEEQSRQSQSQSMMTDKTDDGDTSGEESESLIQTSASDRWTCTELTFT